MELALYAPICGYYETERPIGRRGDFFTSVSVGPVFGQLLGWQFCEWSKDISDFRVVEAGAHDGRLALDILTATDLPSYTIVENSSVRRHLQQSTLATVASRVTWVDSLEELGSFSGVLFCNELLDAFPVKLLKWNKTSKTWHELGMAMVNHQFDWVEIGSTNWPANIPREIEDQLPDQFLYETSPQAEDWWRQAISRLHRGRLLAFDYGFTTEELLHRSRGTLRAYRDHQLNQDILSNPGRQDLTAHVHFSVFEEIGRAAGLESQLATQGQFLTRILESRLKAGIEVPWSQKERSQFMTLTHPSHLGTRFRVLSQLR